MANNVGNARGSSANQQQTQAGHVTNGASHTTSVNSNGSVVSYANEPSHVSSQGVTIANGTTQVRAPLQANGTNGTAHNNCGSANIATNGVSVRQAGALSGSAAWFRPDNVPAPITFLNHGSSADDTSGNTFHPIQADTIATAVKAMPVQQPIGTRGANYNPIRHNVSFTTDVGPNANVPGGHYLKLDRVVGKEVTDLMKTVDNAFDWQSKVTGLFSPAPIDTAKKTALYLRFDDVRDAAAAFEQVETVNPTYHLAYISQSEWSAAQRDSQHGTPVETSFFDGQVLFTCQFKGSAVDFQEQNAALEGRVRDLAKEAGHVLVFDHHMGEDCKIVYRVEYCKISAAQTVINHVTDEAPKSIGGWIITTSEMVHLAPELKTITPPVNGLHLMTMGERKATPQHRWPRDIVTEFISPTGRTAWGVDILGNTVHLPPPMPVARVKGPLAGQQFAFDQLRAQSDSFAVVPFNGGNAFTPQDFRSVSWPGAHARSSPTPFAPLQTQALATKTRKQFTPDGPNKIYPSKIEDGTDVRTSIMVRNLPNELSFDDLKCILDHTSRGRYDFSYLRIDFNNGKNVGYGFVNFVNAEDIIPFHATYFGKPWLPHTKYQKKGPPRLADLSYATIQGLDCLIDKMRNSSVMDENPDSRPKLWWTAETAVREGDIGEERPFPGVNNLSKKQRSRENAAQIGLYTHGSRQARSQRGYGHQSHFDRGTPAQIQEEAFWNTMGPNTMTPYQSSYGYSNQTPYYGGFTPRVFMAPQGMGMVTPPHFPQFQQFPQPGGHPHNQFYPVVGNSMRHINPGQGVDFTDPFIHGEQVHGMAQSNGNFYANPHRHEAIQYGPMNEVVSMPNSEQGSILRAGQEPQEMPAIPEETEGHVAAHVNGQSYHQNGYSYTTPECHQPQ